MKAYYCVGTHWDREWYETFQEFRMWLVEQIDEVMDLMDQEPAFERFHLDGQAVVLEDYLEVRPENRERLLVFLKERRILAGPWYVLPDEWLISGESFIRNLMMGIRVCRELGFEPMDFSYTPDQFGHVAALPMLVTGFGMRTGICWRGSQDESYPAQFVWVGPDGSRMVTHKLRDADSYNGFDYQARRPIEDAAFSDDSFKEHFESYFEAEKKHATVPAILMIDAVDHQRAPKAMPRLMAELRKRYPDIEFIWSTFEDYGKALLENLEKLPERTGEMRQPARDSKRHAQYLIVHTLSSRYPIKRRNDECQAMLEKWAEPCALFQAMAGAPNPATARYLDLAWKYLIRNHPHDSICGCSIDQVHRDMVYRFDQCSEICDGLIRRAMAHTGAAGTEQCDTLAIHNPLPFNRKGIFDLPVLFGPKWPTAWLDGLATGEHINKFILRSAEGQELPYQLLKIERATHCKGLSETGRRINESGDRYHLVVEMELPACGYTTVTIEPTDEATRNFGSMMQDTFSAMNGSLLLSVDPGGTAMVHCLDGDLFFDDLFIYEDCGDAGDGWTYGKLTNDLVARTPGSRVSVYVEDDGPLRTVFRIEREFDLPKCMDRRTWWRSSERKVLSVTDWLTLDKGAPFVRVHTSVENNCQDHRFRVLFPTGLDADQSFAETPFAVVHRDIDIPSESARWHERVNPETAFTTFFGVQGQEGGLAVLAPFGLHEYEVTQNADRALAVTLFRSTFQTVGTAGEPDGQLQGRLEYDYLLYPFAGAFDPVAALRMVAEAQTGTRAHSTGSAPQTKSFLKLENDTAIVTAIKPALDGRGGVVRLWNPAESDSQDRLVVPGGIKHAELCNLNEERVGEAPIEDGNAIPITIKAGGLTTVRFEWS